MVHCLSHTAIVIIEKKKDRHVVAHCLPNRAIVIIEKKRDRPVLVHGLLHTAS